MNKQSESIALLMLAMIITKETPFDCVYTFSGANDCFVVSITHKSNSGEIIYWRSVTFSEYSAYRRQEVVNDLKSILSGNYACLHLDYPDEQMILNSEHEAVTV